MGTPGCSESRHSHPYDPLAVKTEPVKRPGGNKQGKRGIEPSGDTYNQASSEGTNG